MEEVKILYVYQKNNVWKVLDHIRALEQHEGLIQQGFKHEFTIDPISYIENMLNDNELLKAKTIK